MTDLRQAAQAVIDRWDSPLWKAGTTADAIADLRAALKQPAKPVALDKIKHGHSKMRLFDFEQHSDHEYAGLPHRPYATSYSEGCYLCATLAEIERLQTKLEQQAEPPTCEWSSEDDDTMPSTYRSACGELWSFIDGGWKDNRVRYCHGCGGNVVEASSGIQEPKP